MLTVTKACTSISTREVVMDFLALVLYFKVTEKLSFKGAIKRSVTFLMKLYGYILLITLAVCLIGGICLALT